MNNEVSQPPLSLSLFFQTHLPGYVKQFEEIKGHGIDEIVCVAVNDPFVMQAWGENQGATGKIHMLADTTAELAYGLGLELTAVTEALGNVRCKRFSLIAVDNVVKV